ITVLVLLNGESPSTERILTRYHAQYENIEFLKSEKARKGAARNILLRHVRTELVYFLDDDVTVSGDTCSVMLESMEKYPQADIIGGPNLTPPASELFQVAQGAALGSFFGTLWMSRRYTRCGKPVVADERMLILCNLAFRRRVFEKSNICFNNSIICAEENLLLQELMCAGYKAMYVPGLIVYHERRKNYSEFCRQIFTYGRGRCQAVKCHFRMDNLLYCIPAMFLAYLGALLVWYWPGYLLPGYAYLTVCLFNAVKKAIETKHHSLFWGKSCQYKL
ncbi:MAG: glycosyltransferase, partial [Pseudomonadota bacterium]